MPVTVLQDGADGLDGQGLGAGEDLGLGGLEDAVEPRSRFCGSRSPTPFLGCWSYKLATTVPARASAWLVHDTHYGADVAATAERASWMVTTATRSIASS
jgi:hypothetical protein